MPHFRWRGVTSDGRWRRGRACAISPEQLTARMLQRGVALTKVKPLTIYSLWLRVPHIEQAQSLETIALLSESGMQLAESCVVTAETVENPLLQECWVHQAAAIESGAGITDQSYLARIFGPFIAHLLVVGYQAGTFTSTARVSAHYARASHELKSKLRSALAMPLVTLLFVFGLLWLLFAFLVPSLTSLFSQFNATLPASTQAILAISAVAQSRWFFVVLGIIVMAGLIYRMIARRYQLQNSLTLHMPFIGTLYAQWQRMLFVQALAALLQGGMSLRDALHCIAELMPSAPLRAYAAQLAYAVDGGITFSDALATNESPISTPLMVAMVRVGQESNKLVPLLQTLVDRESTQLLMRLQTTTAFMQPLLIILLGLVVLAVIGAIYMPLINIAQIVQ